MYTLRPILKTYYDALEESRVLGMKCADCGDVTWPPLPICQQCGSTTVDWTEMGNDAVIEEIRFEDSSVGGDYTFRKANDFFANKEIPYCICVGKFPAGTHKFHAALYGINQDNLAQWKANLPFVAPVHYIEMAGDFKAVGFKIPNK